MAGRVDVRGRSVLVTGGAQGIGFETARRLHARGAHVALADVQAEKVREAAASLGDGVLGLELDVRDRAAVGAVVDEVVGTFGGLDVVLANAGVSPAQRTVRTMGDEEFQRVLDVNLHGVVHTVQAALPHVVARRGHLLLVASMYAFMNPLLAGPYAVSKAGVEALGRALRTELAAHGASAGVAYFAFYDTQLAREPFESEAIRTASAAMPAWITRHRPVAEAADVVVRGIERRRARVMAPWWLPAMSLMRGPLQVLLDDRLRDDAAAREAVRLAER